MKTSNLVAITGTKKGLGFKLKNKFDNVLEINRELVDISDYKKVVDIVKDCDIFINNAYSDFCQTDILYELFQKWKNEKKTIVNIISRSKYQNISKGYLYSTHKAALSHLSNNLRFLSDKKCRIIDVNPGLLNSEIPSLTYEEVAKIIKYIIDLPFHIEVGEISVWNTTPYKTISNLKDEAKN